MVNTRAFLFSCWGHTWLTLNPRYQLVKDRPAKRHEIFEFAQALFEEVEHDVESRIICAEALFCQSELWLKSEDSSMILETATSSIELLKSVKDDTWRTPRLYNRLALGNIMIKDYKRAIEVADLSIADFLVLAGKDPRHYPDFPMVNKGYALMSIGTTESLDAAADVLLTQQSWREQTSDRDPVPRK